MIEQADHGGIARRISSRAIRVSALILCSVLVACETQFDPFADSDRHFTILGFLDTDADTQFVRVVPQRLVVLRGPEIDATVRSTDLTEGRTVVWTDSLILYSDSTYGHVFWSVFNALPEHRYRFEVERSDGVLARAETTVPRRPGDPETVYGALNESADFAPLFWPGVTEVIDADVLYEISPYGCFGKGDLQQKSSAATIRHRFRYEGDARGRLTIDNEWRFEMDLWGDHQVLVELSGVTGPFCAILRTLQVRLASPSTDFDPPGGVWDPNVLIQPGTFSNVDGGFGFFGSVARTTVDWSLSPVAMMSLGYDPPG